MEKIVVGVSGINAIDNPGPGVGIARSLKLDKELAVEIAGLSYDAMDPGNYMDWLIDRSFIMPYPSSDHQAFIERLLYIKNSCGLDVVIPTLDAELPFYIRYQEELNELGIITFLPTMEQFKLRGKDKLVEIGEKIGLSVPQTRVVSSEDDLLAAVEEITLPVMVKGAFYKAEKATTLQSALNSFHKIGAEWGYPLIIQQIVTGEEMNVVAVGDGEGGSLGMVGIKKLWMTEQGKIWTGVSIQNEGMIKATERFLQEYHWKSAFELECLVDGDQIHLIEINPRFPAWSYFAAAVGINLPALMLRKLLNLKLPPQIASPEGKLYVRYTYELVTDLEPFQKISIHGER
jgi:carbamoyl-phosphate synthase large subunit